ncbi:hypothetical protein RJ639_030657 [Escallonia herrerae]|uniref:VWFA domain-containing protein n=1 Tax=Escallonia herrerae TaxID=1293975 RepID=A0AA89BIM8_9ASTE|nr:hypothetical protein RJ639_030657 [Escallonia herrerae]
MCECILLPIYWFKMLAMEMHWSFTFGVVMIYGVSQGLGGVLSRVGTEFSFGCHSFMLSILASLYFLLHFSFAFCLINTICVQGVCISAYIMDKVDQDELNVIHQLEEIHQRLLRKYEYEKAKLEASFGATQQELLLADISACCVFSPHMLCQKPGFEIWVDTLPIVDETSFFLDMRILQELSKIYVLEDEELQLFLTTMNIAFFSLIGFISSVWPSGVYLEFFDELLIKGSHLSAKISSFVLEMWFRWHTSLWSHGPALAQNRLGLLVNAALFPDMIFQPVKTAAIDNILQSSTIRDYSVQRLKLSVASRNVWQSYPCVVNIHSFFLLAARSLFHQIILAHKKSFEADKFSAIKSLLAYAQENLITERDMNLMISLLASSSHHGLTSLIKSFVEPLIGDIYLKSSSTDPVYTVGCSWLRLGGLRYHLLICCDDLDPAVKYSLKYSQLMGKIGALELETEVRKECAHLAGCAPFREADKQRKMLLEKLEAERTRLHKKVVFRSDPGKFKKLKYECDEFVKLVTTSVCLAKDADSMNIEALTDHMQNWQETATCFIERLSSEYSGYLDIVQPVQVAIYEMKLGLSLVLSSAFCKEFVDRVDVDDIDIVLGTVYEFVRFPRGCASKAVSLMDESRQGKFSSSCIKFSTNISAIDINLLEKLVTLSRDVNTDKTVPDLQMKAVIHQNLLRRVAHSAAEDRFMDNDSFMLLDKIFEEFASSWVKMKVQLKTREDYEAQQYKFRPRAFKIENVIGIDISSLGKSISNESFEEWQELVSEEKPTEADEGHEILEEDWNFLQDSLVNDMVNIHNALFGSEDLVQTCGSFQVSDADRLSSFIDSYTVGIRIIRDLKGLSSSRLDARLVPEHLLRLCLEHEEKFILSPKPEHGYNFYKDSNASLMVKLVEPVLAFQQRILRLLSEWDNHLALQKIMDVIEMILSIPLDTPLAKALSGLQFLLSRVRILQETVSKFPLNDLLEPIFLLVSSWQKLEFESWPALLDDVQAQFETNAGKVEFTFCTLEEFIKTSCVGEFRKRLQLLFAFHGQISTGISRECYSRVLGHIEAKRRSIEVELKELIKLCRWERSDMYMTMDISKRTRQKLRKLIQKYTDVLQQPVMLIVHQVAAQRGTKTQVVLGPPNLGHSFDQTQLSDNDRCIWWFSTWEKKVNFALQNLELGRTTQFDFPHNSFKDVKEGARIIRDCIASPSLFLTYQEEIKQTWYTIEKISGTAIEDAEVWDDENKSSGKRRPLCELLLSNLQNLLESSGLAKHRSTSLKEGMSTGDMDIAALDQLQRSHPRSPETEWKDVNGYHFKSIASLHRLLQIGLNFHKDFNPEQVNRSCSYIDHLIAIQQDQRAAAYDFAEKLKGLRACILPLESLLSSSNSLDSLNSSDCSFAQNQHVTYKCMWQQKQLFDCLCATMHDECLLLRTVEHNHLSTCESVAVEAKHLRLSLEKFVPDLQKSKELFDLYLLGHNRSIITLEVNLHQYGVTKQMEQLVHKNFLVIKEFEDHLSVLIKQDVHGVSISGALLGHFKDIFEKGKIVAEEYYSGLQASCPSEMVQSSNHSTLQVRFDEALGAMYSRIVGVYCRVGSWSGRALSDKSFENIPVWKDRFDSNVADLQLDAIRDELIETTQSAGEMVGHNSYGNPSLCSLVGAHIKHLHSLVDPILTLSDSLLHDFVVISRKVSVMTHMLAEIFTSLYSHGFGISEEDQLDDTGRDKTQEAKGTGMGEGAGLNDVSDQITDEDQLLGTSEKPSEEQDVLNDAPGNNDKGIEMEQDFAAATLSVSEESGDDDDGDGEDEQLESAMGETGTNSEIVDERLWDKDDGDDEKPSSRNEKYESGPSVEDKDPSSRELRAKDETTSNADEAGEHDPNEIDTKNDDDNKNSEGLDSTESMEGMNIDKEEAFSDPTGLKLDEPNRGSDEDISMDEPESVDPVEDVVPDENNNGPEENTTTSVDDVLNDMEPEEMEENSEQDDPEHKESITEMDSEGPKNDVFEPDTPSNGKSAPQPGCVSLASAFRDAALESNWHNFNDTQNDLAPMSGLPNATDNEMLVADSSKGGKLSDEQPKTQLPQPDSSLLQKIQPNPCRNVGDALDGWKERAKVSVDLQDDNSVEAPVDVGDEDVGEYGFTFETDKGTAQALGPAASDQTDNKINEKKPDGEATTANREEHTEMETEELPHDSRPVKSNAVNLGNKIEDRMEILNLEKRSEESLDVDCDHDREKMLDSFVSLRRSSMNEIHQLGKLSVSEDGIGEAQNLELLSSDMNANATSLWQRYELLTTRLSQELAEQLRLVMEPTLASKLQGDYKTGKRINMKKVISYIASHYRKDKIWLRRTRPNKRDYQVVIAVDDSRSMSESHCRDVAIEALVTVCRAMSQLEVGNLAVTSFGKKGNIRLLHDFDHPFNREAGVKMLSSLTFNQENTIADEPVGDLLKYLNIMLDTAVANARLPSGHNPLQQLVLIIADGLFHEKKENLKRCVRDILSKKRMVAFLLLDSPDKSIVDLEEVIFQGGKVKFPKYMDSFPFPFYAVVRNIESLPRTLADLLRQWFELMQYSRD